MKSHVMHMELVSADGTKTRIGLEANALGSGADAAVYRIADHPDLAAKVYHDPDKDPHRPEKIRAMMATPPDLPAIRNNGMCYHQTAWPAGMLVNPQGKFAGYAMPFVDLKHSTVLENLLAAKSRELLGLPDFYGFRISAAANLASLVDALHQCGHHIIDLKPVNINVYTDTFYTALLDCDGLSVQGADGHRFAAHQYTENYIAPEAMRQNLKPGELGAYQDCFALAVIIFQLLNRGIHPYQGIPLPGLNVPPTTGERIRANLYAHGLQVNAMLKPSPWSIHAFFENDTRRLFDRAFGSHPQSRPTADEWKAHLRHLLDESNPRLKRCLRNANHAYFSKGCGFCHLEKQQARSQRLPSGKKQPKKRAFSPKQASRQQQAIQQAPSTKLRSGIKRWAKRLLAITTITGIILLGRGLYYKHNNIHRIIERNDIEAFKSRHVNRNDFTRDDAMAALGHSDATILLTLIEHITPLPQDYEFITRLIDSNHRQALEAYEDRMRNLAEGDKLNKNNPAFKAIFLEGKKPYIESILRCQADPNEEIWPSDQHSWPKPSLKREYHRIISSMAERSGQRFNHWLEGRGSPTLRVVMKKFSFFFSIPAERTDRLLHRIAEYYQHHNKGRQHEFWLLQIDWKIRPVHIAALNNDQAYIHLLIDHGADLNNSLVDGRSAAQLTGNRQINTMLSIGRTKLSPFYQAIAQDDTDQFDDFMQSQAVKRLEPDEPNPFEFAVDHGSLRIVDHFYHKYDKAFNKDDASLLIKAYHSQNPMLLAYLLEKGGNLNKKVTSKQLSQVFSGNKPHTGSSIDYLNWKLNYLKNISEAVSNKKPGGPRIGALLNRKAKIDGRWDVVQILDAYQSGWQLIHYAAVQQQLSETIKSILFADPTAIQARDKLGRPPLILAAYYDCADNVRLLMEYGADNSQKDNAGYGALHYAAHNGNPYLVDLLLSDGAGKANKKVPNCQSAVDKVQALNETFNKAIDTLSSYERAPFEAEINRRKEAVNRLINYYMRKPEIAHCQ